MKAKAIRVIFRADAHEDEEARMAVSTPPTKSDQPGADQVPYTFNIRHDAGNQVAGSIGIVKGDRQAANMLLDLHTQVGDETLGGL